MRENSTIAIQEVDEEDHEYNLANQKTVNPRELPHLDYSPIAHIHGIKESMLSFPKFEKKRFDGLFLIEENEQIDKIFPRKH